MDKNNYFASYFPFTPVSNCFIEDYMLNTKPIFVVIYLYLLKMTLNSKEIFLNKVVNKLDILESDLVKCLNHWQEKEIITYKINEDNKIDIFFLEIKNNTNTNIIINKEKTYTDSEILFYSQQEEVKQLFKVAENKLAKTLTSEERKKLINLYDNYGISIEIFAMLLTYCKEKGKTAFNYIQKVAIDWVENGIDTVEKLERYIKFQDKDIKAVMKAFGYHSDRDIIKNEVDYIKKWIFEYKIPINMIEEACTRTIMKTGKANFKYANSIISNWYQNKILTKERLKEEDINFENSKKSKLNEKSTSSVTSKSKFINYKQNKVDFEELRKLEIAGLKEGLE